MNGISLKTEILVLLIAVIITLSTVVVVQWITARADKQDKLDTVKLNIVLLHQKQAAMAEQIEEILEHWSWDSVVSSTQTWPPDPKKDTLIRYVDTAWLPAQQIIVPEPPDTFHGDLDSLADSLLGRLEWRYTVGGGDSVLMEVRDSIPNAKWRRWRVDTTEKTDEVFRNLEWRPGERTW